MVSRQFGQTETTGELVGVKQDRTVVFRSPCIINLNSLKKRKSNVSVVFGLTGVPPSPFPSQAPIPPKKDDDEQPPPLPQPRKKAQKIQKV